MGRLRFAPVATGYVAVVALLTVASRLPAYRSDLLSFVALAATLPTGLAYPLLALVPRHLGWYALPALALLNALVLRRLRRLLPRDPVARGVEDRLHRALVAIGVKVTPMARAGPRRTRGLLLRDVPIVYPQLVGVVGDRWREAGLRVRRQEEPLALRGYDAQGYEFSLEPGPGVFGDAVLTVTAPASRHRAFAAGLAAGGLPGMAAGLTATYPALLVTGCAALVGGLACLAAPHTRSFGRGMLLGGLPALLILWLYGTA
ncbi:hypothetical protein [Actinoplanes sp. NPDC049599]|uniref:hypothetical protein n=1 Tax=Actinoplanes sp. NPDC049599 TaxID=3363903 RepID=UPI0037B56335